MSRHAYLIIVHSDPNMLEKLVESIDDSRNDIFIHVDQKTDINLYSAVKTQKANLKFIDNRVAVYWGDSSQIDSEYALLQNIRWGGVFQNSPFVRSGFSFEIPGLYSQLF